MNVSIRPSGESAGDEAESAKLVSCVYGCRTVFGRLPESRPEPRTGGDEREQRSRRHSVNHDRERDQRSFDVLSSHATEIDDQLAHRLVAVCRIFLERFLDDDPQRQRHVVGQRLRVAVNNRADDVDDRRRR